MAARSFLFGLALAAVLAFAPNGVAGTSPAYIVVDVDKGTVLSHRSAARLWYPASITKIMTAYVVFRALEAGEVSLRSPVKISKNALAQAPSKMGFKVGTVLNIDNALKMMIVKSANDIAVAIAETVGGSEATFVERMNAEAKRLGMNSTRFNNPNGLPDDEQWSTARDLAILARAVWRHFPDYRDYFQIPAIRVGKKLLRSHNTLLERFQGANGMKTGYICSSGFNVVASATREDRTVMVVVLGSPSSGERAELAASLLNRGFSSWISLTGRPPLESFRATRARGEPTDLRDLMCTAAGREARAAARKEPKQTALVPRFKLMDPVRVYTGDAAVPLRNVPLPRLRPVIEEQSAALADEDAAAVQ